MKTNPQSTALLVEDDVVSATTQKSFLSNEKPAKLTHVDTKAAALAFNQLLDSYEINHYERKRYHNFIGASQPMQTIYRIINNVATSKASVFITGESGTGKELCAKAIHEKSERKDKPFITLNCAVIPKNLMESKIFGHVNGAFSGADEESAGAASLANGGTLFLDEIGDMDLERQHKLLRLVQTGTLQKVGSHKSETVDIRFICATHRNPMAEIEAGRFCKALYYRLSVIPITLPPLRKCEEDVLLLAKHFLAHYAQEESKFYLGFAPKTEILLRRYQWPGNVRQLQNVIRHIVLLNDGPIVTPSMLPSPLKELQSARQVESLLTSTINTNGPFCWQTQKEQTNKMVESYEGHADVPAIYRWLRDQEKGKKV